MLELARQMGLHDNSSISDQVRSSDESCIQACPKSFVHIHVGRSFIKIAMTFNHIVAQVFEQCVTPLGSCKKRLFSVARTLKGGGVSRKGLAT